MNTMPFNVTMNALHLWHLASLFDSRSLMAVARMVALSLANPIMEFDDYSRYSNLSDEELIQLATELSLAEMAVPQNPIQNRQPPPPPVVQRPANPNPRPRLRIPNLPPANPPPANPNSAHPPSGNPLIVRLKK